MSTLIINNLALINYFGRKFNIGAIRTGSLTLTSHLQTKSFPWVQYMACTDWGKHEANISGSNSAQLQVYQVFFFLLYLPWKTGMWLKRQNACSEKVYPSIIKIKKKKKKTGIKKSAQSLPDDYQAMKWWRHRTSTHLVDQQQLCAWNKCL